MKNIICKASFFGGGGGGRGQRLDNNGFVPCSAGVNVSRVQGKKNRRSRT